MILQTGYFEFPQPAVHPCVEALWSFVPEQRGYHRVLPDGRIDLLVRFRRDGDTIGDLRLIIAGPAKHYSWIPMSERTALLGIRFRPGWGGACLGIEAAALRDVTLVGQTAVQALGAVVLDRLLAARAVEDLRRLLAVTADSLSHRAERRAPQPRALTAIELIHRSGGLFPVARLAQALGVSVRTLHRDLRETAGISAKALTRIVRFQRTLRLLQVRAEDRLSVIALDAGYSDQAHMAKEFRLLGGLSAASPTDAPLIGYDFLTDFYKTPAVARLS